MSQCFERVGGVHPRPLWNCRVVGRLVVIGDVRGCRVRAPSSELEGLVVIVGVRAQI